MTWPEVHEKEKDVRTIEVADVFIRVRTVALPADCPHCRADLTLPEAILVGRLNLVYYESSVRDGALQSEVEPLDDAFDLDHPSAFVMCTACGIEPVAVRGRKIEVVAPEGGESAWSAIVDHILVDGSPPQVSLEAMP